MTRTYVILNQEQLNTCNYLLDNNASLVTRTTVTIDQTNNLHTIGGQNIPAEQIRDYRANRLENSHEVDNVIAYTANIPVSPSEDNATSLNDTLRQTIITFSSEQRIRLENAGIAENDIIETESIANIIETAVEGFIETTSSDMQYALRVFNSMSNINSNSNNNVIVHNTDHLFYLNSLNNFSENLNRQISATMIHIPGGTLASRILNIFLALGTPFMRFIYSRFLELSSFNVIELSGFMNLSTQQFFVLLRHFLSGLFILFLGLDYFVSIDLNTFILALRSATISVNLLLNILSSYSILMEPRQLSENLTNSFRRVTNFTSERNQNFWAFLRSFYLPLDSYIRYFLRFPLVAGGTIAATTFIIQIMQFTRSFDNLPLLRERVGPVTNFVRHLQSAIVDFLRRFRHY